MGAKGRGGAIVLQFWSNFAQTMTIENQKDAKLHLVSSVLVSIGSAGISAKVIEIKRFPGGFQVL